MKRRSTVEDWRRAVFSAPPGLVSDATKVLLLYLADHMRGDDLKVSVPRPKIAKDLGRSERRVTSRFREAVGELPPLTRDAEEGAAAWAAREAAWAERSRHCLESRLLDRVVRGTKHSQAVYQGLMPGEAAAVNRTPSRRVENQGQQDAPEPVENDEIRPVENPPLSVKSRSQQDTRGSRLTTAEPSREVENRNSGNEQEGHQTAPTCRHGVEHGTEPDPWEAGALVCAACDRDQSEREEAL